MSEIRSSLRNMVIGAVVTLLAMPAFALEEPSAQELLAEYAKAQDKLGCSFISRHISTIKWEAYTPLRPDIKKGVRYTSYVKVELRSDGNRHYSLFRMWGDRPPVRGMKEEDASFEYALWDGKLRYRYGYSPISRSKLRENGHLRLTPAGLLTARPRRSIEGGEGTPLRGFFYGTSDRIDIELRAAESISVLRRRPVINRSKCYVIDATAKGCQYRLWIDPQHDYHIAKAIVSRGWKSMNDRRVTQNRLREGAKAAARPPSKTFVSRRLMIPGCRLSAIIVFIPEVFRAIMGQAATTTR